MNQHLINHGFDMATRAGEEMSAKRQFQSGASKRKKIKKHEETRASLEGGLLYESNVQLANVV